MQCESTRIWLSFPMRARGEVRSNTCTVGRAHLLTIALTAPPLHVCVQKLDHPRIVKMYEVFYYGDFIYVVMELYVCAGGRSVLSQAEGKSHRLLKNSLVFVLRRIVLLQRVVQTRS